jgi:hypothetical protein
VKLAVVHLKERVQDAALYGLEAILKVGDGAVFDNIGSVFQKIFVKKVFNVCHKAF